MLFHRCVFALLYCAEHGAARGSCPRNVMSDYGTGQLNLGQRGCQMNRTHFTQCVKQTRCLNRCTAPPHSSMPVPLAYHMSPPLYSGLTVTIKPQSVIQPCMPGIFYMPFERENKKACDFLFYPALFQRIFVVFVQQRCNHDSPVSHIQASCAHKRS